MSSETTASTPAPSRRGERFAMIGTVVSALAASSCCWVPLLLLLLAATGLTSASLAGNVFVKMSAFIEAYRWPLIVVTFAFLGLAFYLVYRPRPAAAEGCEAPC